MSLCRSVLTAALAGAAIAATLALPATAATVAPAHRLCPSGWRDIGFTCVPPQSLGTATSVQSPGAATAVQDQAAVQARMPCLHIHPIPYPIGCDPFQ